MLYIFGKGSIRFFLVFIPRVFYYIHMNYFYEYLAKHSFTTHICFIQIHLVSMCFFVASGSV